MNLKKKIAEKEEARMEKQVQAMNAKASDEKKERQRKANAKWRAKQKAKKKAAISQKETTAAKESSAIAEETSDVQIPNQAAKADCGKPQLSLVPTEILTAIARIREYGNRKYKSKDNWMTVEIERYRDAAYRHWVSYINDPKSIDKESGHPHLWHVACNIAFLIALEDKTCNLKTS